MLDRRLARRLDRYRIVERIGAGGMGEVYRAIDEAGGGEVALKVLHPWLRSDPAHRARFREEARVLAGLVHPNICALRGAGSCDGVDFLALELLSGRTLRARLPLVGAPAARLLNLAVQMGRALAAAHACRRLHGDFKPENVFITHQEIVKVIDFGLARCSSSPGARPATSAETTRRPSRMETLSIDLISPGRVCGTVLYMSPEQIRGEALDERSDLFSFGVVLHEMLTGHLPFLGRTAADAVASILRDDPVPPSVDGTPWKEAVYRIARRCLAKDTRDRWPCAETIVAALERAIDRLDGLDGLQSGVRTPAAPVRTALRTLHGRVGRNRRGYADRGRDYRRHGGCS